MDGGRIATASHAMAEQQCMAQVAEASQPQIAEASQPATSLYRVVSKATVRDGCEKRGSKKVGSLQPGTVVAVLEKGVNSRGQARLKTAAGWLSLVAQNGTVLLEDVRPDPPVQRGVLPDDELDRSEREDLAADMTAWLLDHPDGDLSGWVTESEWVKSIGSDRRGSCVASRCWPQVFAEQKRQMKLLPLGAERASASFDFDDLRVLGRQWAMASVVCDEDAIHEPLSAPGITPDHGTVAEPLRLGPTTWSDVRDAAKAAQAVDTACGLPPASAAASTVSSPQSDVAPPPVVDKGLVLPCGSTHPVTIASVNESDHDADGDDGTEEWTHVDADCSAWTSSASAMSEERRPHKMDTEWELVDTE